MPYYTRRRLLKELSVVSASIAGVGLEACCSSAPTADLYVMLQGPWLLSTTNESYLRVVTARLPSHYYHYFDPHPDPWPVASADTMKDGLPVLQASGAIDISARQLLQFRVDRGCGCESTWTLKKRGQLFDAMRDRSHGLFYSSGVCLPETLDRDLRPLEIRLSYPDAVFAMGVQRKFKFDNLDYVVDKRVRQWPLAIILRYRTWKSATLSGDGISPKMVPVGTSQVHRKFGITYPVPILQGAADSNEQVVAQAVTEAKYCKLAGRAASWSTLPDSIFSQTIDPELDTVWEKVMKLMKFKYEKTPRPELVHCKPGSETSTLKTPYDSAITQSELDCLPGPPAKLDARTKLAASTAGSAGVFGPWPR